MSKTNNIPFYDEDDSDVVSLFHTVELFSNLDYSKEGPLAF